MKNEHPDIFEKKTKAEAIKTANEMCARCTLNIDCRQCDLDTKTKVAKRWDELHPKTTTSERPKLKVVRPYRFKNGDYNSSKKLGGLKRRLYETVNTKEKPSEVFLELAHKHGVPGDITTADAALEYAETHTARYKRHTIAYYMCKEYNTNPKFKRRGHKVFRRK